MRAPPTPLNEAQRLATLRALGLLDTPAEERFDRITRLAQRLFGVPISLVSLIDEDRQWFKSRQGLEAPETPRVVSFCAHAINGQGVLQVPDARADHRFADNPLVVGDPRIRFYAGCPIAGPDGSPLGTLCVIDRQVRTFSENDLRALADLAAMVEQQIASVHLAIADEMTGLSNRRGFYLLGEKVLDVCLRQLVPAALVYVDLDSLKPINDELGHAQGDRAIREVADVLGVVFRASDVIARVGGDEYAVLLSATTGADVAVGRLRAELEKRNSAPDARGALSVSVGRATFEPLAPITLDQLVAAADADMYVEKAAKHAARSKSA